MTQRELSQHFSRLDWVEHDSMEISQTHSATAQEALVGAARHGGRASKCPIRSCLFWPRHGQTSGHGLLTTAAAQGKGLPH